MAFPPRVFFFVVGKKQGFTPVVTQSTRGVPKHTGRLRSGKEVVRHLTGRVRSGQEVSKHHGSGRVGSGRVRPDTRGNDSTRAKPLEITPPKHAAEPRDCPLLYIFYMITFALQLSSYEVFKPSAIFWTKAVVTRDFPSPPSPILKPPTGKGLVLVHKIAWDQRVLALPTDG